MALLDERKLEYNQHRDAGYDLYNEFRCQLTIDIQNGNKTLEEALEISRTLEPVSFFLINGDWKSARVKLSQTLSNVYCTKSIIDQLLTTIDTYISTNYTW